MSLVSLQQENVNKIDKSMKVVNSEGKNLHIFWTTWWISMKDVAFDHTKSKKKIRERRGGVSNRPLTILLRVKISLSRACKKEAAVFTFLKLWRILVNFRGPRKDVCICFVVPENCFLDFYLVKEAITCHIIKIGSK